MTVVPDAGFLMQVTASLALVSETIKTPPQSLAQSG
jgi:hypothetical protein